MSETDAEPSCLSSLEHHKKEIPGGGERLGIEAGRAHEMRQPAELLSRTTTQAATAKPSTSHRPANFLLYS